MRSKEAAKVLKMQWRTMGLSRLRKLDLHDRKMKSYDIYNSYEKKVVFLGSRLV